jgi:leucyl aminopeptidase
MFSNVPRASAIPIHLVFESDLERWLQSQSAPARSWLDANRFRAERGRICLIPGATGQLAAVALGVGKLTSGDQLSLWHTAGLAERLPAGDYCLAGSLTAEQATRCVQGFVYGGYRFDRYRAARAASEVRLVPPDGLDLARVEHMRSACSRARDLINTAAGEMTPARLAQEIETVGIAHGAKVEVITGEQLLHANFPMIHAVGRASSVEPRLVNLEWGEPDAPRLTLVGKGVCFDSGGLDIKSAASMLLMKKDMGGAACATALAELVMAERLPVRLRLLVPAVENAIAGNAYRPGDVLASRKGLTVEVGNTDAEGRLVLADALALADEEQPDLLIDLATLTGAARVALGPDLPALFSSDDGIAASVLAHAERESDPLWRLPLFDAYDEDLASKIADVGNVSGSAFAGAIIGALFLRRFVTATERWMHVDLYAWNPKDRPGRPVGGEAQAVRGLFAFLRARYG